MFIHKMDDLAVPLILEMIRFAEYCPQIHPVATAVVIKYCPKNEVIEEMLVATSAWKPPTRAGGRNDWPYDLSYRLWSINTLGKVNLGAMAPPLQERMLHRLNYLAKEASEAQIKGEAKIALTRLGQPQR